MDKLNAIRLKQILIAIFLFQLCGVSLLFSTKAAQQTIIASGSNFEIYLTSGGTLGFQHLGTKYFDTFVASVTVASGTLNGTNATLTMYSKEGSCSFTSQDNGTLSPSELMGIKINGGKIRNQATDIKTGDIVTLVWSGPGYALWFPILFMIGLIGLTGMFAGPIYTIHKVKHGEYRDAFVNGLVVTVIGLALFIAWLWS